MQLLSCCNTLLSLGVVWKCCRPLQVLTRKVFTALNTERLAATRLLDGSLTETFADFRPNFPLSGKQFVRFRYAKRQQSRN